MNSKPDSGTDEDRTFWPDARFAANTESGIRWRDPRSGQEQWSRAVGVDTLLDAGAFPSDPAAVTQASRIKIGPHQGNDGWTVTISRDRLDPHNDSDLVKLLGTQTFVESEVFEDRGDAVEWAEESVPEFADANVRDAQEWRENRREERKKEAAEA